jgi:hypothetical protein
MTHEVLVKPSALRPAQRRFRVPAKALTSCFDDGFISGAPAAAAARREDFKAKIEKRAEQRDAKAAAKEADWAELDASDAIYAVDGAQLAEGEHSWKR